MKVDPNGSEFVHNRDIVPFSALNPSSESFLVPRCEAVPGSATGRIFPLVEMRPVYKPMSYRRFCKDWKCIHRSLASDSPLTDSQPHRGRLTPAGR